MSFISCISFYFTASFNPVEANRAANAPILPAPCINNTSPSFNSVSKMDGNASCCSNKHGLNRAMVSDFFGKRHAIRTFNKFFTGGINIQQQ